MKKFFSLILATLFLVASVSFVQAAEKKSDKIKFNTSKLKKIELVEAPMQDEMTALIDEDIHDVTIFGDATATKAQMVNYIRKNNPDAKLNCTIEEIVDIYYDEAGREGIRPDVAICQAIKETGFWNYGGDVDPKQNNFCGLGATGNKEPGASFDTPQIGARAHIQHLLSYTSTNPPKTAIVDPRYLLIVRFRQDVFGKIKTWAGLGGVWAMPGIHYGEDIVNLWRKALVPSGDADSMKKAESKLKDNPNDPSAYVYRGLVNYNRGDFAKAQADLQKALDIEPLNADILYNLAIAQEKNKDYDGAIRSYSKFIEMYPKNEFAYYNRGKIKLAQKNYNAAIQDFQKALEMESRLAIAQNDIAVAYFRQKKYEDALKAIRTAAEINTTNETIQTNKKNLEACLKK